MGKLHSNTLSARQLVAAVAGGDEDFEWYPTTAEIINTIKADLSQQRIDSSSVLDIGAGDGRVLSELAGSRKYAIEKSRPLLDALPADVFVVGTEFHEQTILDKKVDVIFSNPPYSEYSEWTTRIIREANAGVVYLVIPSRWEASGAIADAISVREGEAEVIGRFDFLNAERQARCNVHVVRISLGSHHKSIKIDPFYLWFSENFKIDIAESARSRSPFTEQRKPSIEDAVSSAIVRGDDLAQVLVELYERDQEKLISTYKQLDFVDGNLLAEMDVDLEKIRGGLQQKYEGLKDLYWRELFNNLDKVTSRLATKSRRKMLDTLTKHTHVDFTVSNIYAIVVWAVKNANLYFDAQLVDLVERLTELGNTLLYQSNTRTFGDQEWRYCRMPKGFDHYGLDYRIIMHSRVGLSRHWYSGENAGLVDAGFELINDLLTIATNLGFDATNAPSPSTLEWDSGVKHSFSCRNQRTGETETLFTAKAFLNGNMHLQLNQDFILRLNVEFGRLKGWLKSSADASSELDIPLDAAQAHFGANLRLDGGRDLLTARLNG